VKKTFSTNSSGVKVPPWRTQQRAVKSTSPKLNAQNRSLWSS